MTPGNIDIESDNGLDSKCSLRLFNHTVNITVNPTTNPTTNSTVKASRDSFHLPTSGVGKSSLISAIFANNVKNIDIQRGHAGREDTAYYEPASKNTPSFILHNSEDFKLTSAEKWDTVKNFIHEKCNEKLPLKDRLHAILVFIETPRTGMRLMRTADERLLSFASTRITVIVVFTMYDRLFIEYFRKAGGEGADYIIVDTNAKTHVKKLIENHEQKFTYVITMTRPTRYLGSSIIDDDTDQLEVNIDYIRASESPLVQQLECTLLEFHGYICATFVLRPLKRAGSACTRWRSWPPAASLKVEYVIDLMYNASYYSAGASAGSEYKYLRKQYLLTGDKKALSQYLKAISGILNNLFYLTPNGNLLCVTDIQAFSSTPSASHKLEHLSCFLSGVLDLGAHLLPETIDVHLIFPAEGRE
ncbi:hypothetical protein DXG01_001581 [Tephrocybe rancida]|nr:hypothetical protein DXG01_001581 [Tephrocybe rancida]